MRTVSTTNFLFAISKRNGLNTRGSLFTSRRVFLQLAALAAAAPFIWKRLPWSRHFRGEIVGANSSVGHLLRSALGLTPSRTVRTRVAIVGSGMAGLSAGWRLRRKGIDDFLVFELDKRVGGNSSSGENKTSAYPWGAHYVPIPTKESRYVRELFEELKIITGYDSQKRPLYDERYICSAPAERLKVGDVWQDGFVPRLGVSETESEEIQKFIAHVEGLSSARGRDGRRLFAIPVDESSLDARDLDGLTMKEWLAREGYTSPALSWYVNYCCRDDFGTPYDQVSAWAGLHYFAARGGESGNTEPRAVITWPEGNGWLVKRLIELVGAGRVRTSMLVTKVKQVGSGVILDVFDGHELVRVEAEAVIYAGPRFTAPYVVEGASALKTFEYAPWLVANISLDGQVPSGHGFQLAWDNVNYSGESLGYVVATHQTIRRYDEDTVLTFYWPLSSGEPKEVRALALKTTHEEWAAKIAHEMEMMHPGISSQIRSIDVCIWAHAMVKPRPGFIWGRERKVAHESLGRVAFAHSDMSGISIFEEAQYRGVTAANRVLGWLKDV